MDAENEKVKVRKIRQTEVQDIFEITDKLTGEVSYDKFPRTLEYTCEDVLEYYE
jgi:hypothetical protein